MDSFTDRNRNENDASASADAFPPQTPEDQRQAPSESLTAALQDHGHAGGEGDQRPGLSDGPGLPQDPKVPPSLPSDSSPEAQVPPYFGDTSPDTFGDTFGTSRFSR